MRNMKTVPYDGMFSLSASSPKWVRNAQGHLVEVPAGQPAWAYDPVTSQPLGQRIEPVEASNLIRRSEDMGPAFWTAGGAASVQVDQLTAPDGTQTMDLVTVGPTGADIFYQATNVFDPLVRVEPSFFCDPNGEIGRLRLTTTSGGSNDQQGGWDIDLSLVNVGDRITRKHPAVTITQEFVTSSDSPGRIGMLFRSPDNVVLAVGIWGCQIESGENSSSYISTFDAASTRAADIATIENVDTAEWYGAAEGAFLIEFSNLQLDLSSTSFLLSDTGNIRWFYATTNGALRCYDGENLLSAGVSLIDAGTIRAVVTWDSSTMKLLATGGIVQSGPHNGNLGAGTKVDLFSLNVTSVNLSELRSRKYLLSDDEMHAWVNGGAS